MFPKMIVSWRNLLSLYGRFGRAVYAKRVSSICWPNIATMFLLQTNELSLAKRNKRNRFWKWSLSETYQEALRECKEESTQINFSYLYTQLNKTKT